jgi:hypothetical protein
MTQPQQPGQLFLLRWRFDYPGKAPVIGMWNSSAIEAWNKNKEGLVRASVEVKDTVTKKTFTRVECDGHDFRNFQWLTLARVNPNFRGSVTPRPEHIGLQLLTTDRKFTVLINGKVQTEFLTEDEKSLNFATFGR